MSDLTILAFGFFISVLWAWERYSRMAAEARWDATMGKLLDRIGAQTPGVLERVDAHEAKQAALVRRKVEKPPEPTYGYESTATPLEPFVAEGTLAEARLDFEDVLRGT